MTNNKIFENENLEHEMYMEDIEMIENTGTKIERGFKTALNILVTICEAISAIGRAMEGVQKISTARDNITTAQNIAQTQRIQSEVSKTKALNHQRRVENRINRKE